MTEKPTDLVRVRDTVTGAHITTRRSKVERNGSRYAILKQDAVDVSGKPLPPKPRVVTEPAKPETQSDSDKPTPTAKRKEN